MRRYAVDWKSCYDPQCKYAKDYFNVENDHLEDGCSMYLWRTKKEDRKNYGKDWGECKLKNSDYVYGYQLPDPNMLQNHHEMYVGLYECHETRVNSEWCNDIDCTPGK